MAQTLASVLDEIFLVLNVPKIQISTPFRGFSHDVFILESNTGQKWSLRIAKNEFAVVLAERSLVILRHMTKVQPAIAVPTIVHVGKDYCIFRYLEGAPLNSWLNPDLSLLERCHLLDSLATFLYQLWTCETFSLQLSTTSTTYRDWLTCEIDKAIRRASQNPGWGHPIDFLRRRASIDELIPNKEDDCEMLIKHGDMNALNILVDNGALSGVIDWDTATVVPAPAAIQHPIFMANIPGFHNDDPLASMDFANDRLYLERSIRKFTPNGEKFADLLTGSNERQFFEMSLRNKHINAEYIRLRHKGKDMMDHGIIGEQLRQFLSENPDMVQNSVLAELQNGLTSAPHQMEHEQQ